MSISPSIHITVDAVIISTKTQPFNIVLIKRKKDPFKNQWALPGGFVEKLELVARGCQRELEEETGLDIDLDDFQFLKYYDAIKRDPRSRTITFAFIAELKHKPEIKGKDDAMEAAWFPVDHLPELAFDHSEIIEDALNHLNY
mgnify:CR=1 FL=1